MIFELWVDHCGMKVPAGIYEIDIWLLITSAS